MVVAGATNKQIGEVLGISWRTAEVHRAHGMLRLRCQNAAELVRLMTLAGY